MHTTVHLSTWWGQGKHRNLYVLVSISPENEEAMFCADNFKRAGYEWQLEQHGERSSREKVAWNQERGWESGSPRRRH